MDRNNFPRRPNLKILSEYRDINSKISLAFFNFQIMRDIGDGKNENNDNNGDKKNSPLIRRSISIISFIFYEEERANVGKDN
jgi:hypothetical protein